MAGPELDAVRRAAGGSDGEDADMLPATIATVTDEVRAHIEDCPENRLGPAGTVPERAIHHALAIVRHRLLGRLNMDAGETRNAEYRDAVAFFRRVSECRVKIELPNPEDVVVEGNIPSTEVVTETPAQMGRTNLGGLF